MGKSYFPKILELKFSKPLIRNYPVFPCFRCSNDGFYNYLPNIISFMRFGKIHHVTITSKVTKGRFFKANKNELVPKYRTFKARRFQRKYLKEKICPVLWRRV